MSKLVGLTRRLPRFIYWRFVWLRNVIRAVIRYILNYLTAGHRFIKNHLMLVLRLIRLGLFELYYKLNNLFRRNKSRLRSPSITLENFDYLTFREGLADFRGQIRRFMLRKKIEFRLKDDELVNLVSEHWQSVSLPKHLVQQSPVVIDATLVFHVYYLDIAIEMINQIKSKAIKFKDIVITYSNPELQHLLAGLLPTISENSPKFLILKNYLRDVAPFLSAIREFAPTGNVLKIHTKKSPHLSSASAAKWRNSLLDGLLPDAVSAGFINDLISKQAVPALYCPAEWVSQQQQWGRNGRFCFEMCQELEIPYLKNAPFPMGTMFWSNSLMNSQLLKVKIPAESPAFSERGLMDGAWPHAFERIPGQIVLAGGLGFQNRK